LGLIAPRDFQFLHEHEWRIALLDRLNGSSMLGRDVINGVEYTTLLIGHEGVRLFVFPDDRTLELAMNRDELKPFLHGRKKPPIEMTIEDANQF
jgi:hypothetical protein